MVWKFFKSNNPDKKTESPTIVNQKVGVTVVEFEDDCVENSGAFLAECLANHPNLQVTFYNDLSDKKFLNLQSRNFFDLIDAGHQVLKTTKSDVVIWGYREKDKIRLNFQTKHQYEIQNLLGFSLLNSLYVPLEYFQHRALPKAMEALIEGVIMAGINSVAYPNKQVMLRHALDNINRCRSPQGLALEYRPYILNMLALVYLHAAGKNITTAEIKLVAGLLDTAIKGMRREDKNLSYDGLLMGNIYTNFGQLFQVASEVSKDKRFLFSRKAAQSLQVAQKYFNRHAFPYDFGINSYRLSQLYFSYWKQTSDIQALRDAVFYLREAEKIFSNIIFPKLWAQIQGDLGFYLSLLGMFGNNDEISLRAVENYKNQQRILTKELKPFEWAKTQESIGNIYYNSGKSHQDEEYLEEAIKYYNSAAEVYENYKFSNEHKQVLVGAAKADECIRQLRRQ